MADLSSSSSEVFISNPYMLHETITAISQKEKVKNGRSALSLKQKGGPDGRLFQFTIQLRNQWSLLA